MSLISTQTGFALGHTSLLRRLGATALALTAALALSLSGSPAKAANPAEAYVQANVQRGLTILSDKNQSKEQMRQKFRNFLESLTSIRRIAVFTLGPTVRTAPSSDVDAFVVAFRDYADAVYESRLAKYSGQTLKITGSVERSAGDYVVSTVMVDPDKTAKGEPVQVDFRVVQDNGKWVVIDVSVVGVWLAIEERDQFTAFLAQHNNDVKALIAHLNTLTTELRKD
ncbi:MAG: ABC transporter substrate-binding protein [Proteobacteria bacterium]|nr:ABC transporter substrate-binding protein [Pseudomonadota bacterium]